MAVEEEGERERASLRLSLCGRSSPGERTFKKRIPIFFIRSKTEDVSGPDRIGTETVKHPFSWTDGLGPVRLTEPRSVFVEPYARVMRGAKFRHHAQARVRTREEKESVREGRNGGREGERS